MTASQIEIKQLEAIKAEWREKREKLTKERDQLVSDDHSGLMMLALDHYILQSKVLENECQRGIDARIIRDNFAKLLARIEELEGKLKL